MRLWKSSLFSNTTARPRCIISAGVAALGLMTAPRGARLPRSTAMPALALNGASSGLMTSVLKFSRVGDVLAHGLAVGGDRVQVQQLARSPSSPPAGRRRSRSPPSGACPRAAGSPGRAARWPAGRSRRSPSSTPMRPAMAIRWITALVEPPIAASVLIAFSNAWRVRIFDELLVLVDHVDDAPAGHARQHVAPAVDGGIGRVAGQADAQRLDHARPSWSPCPWSCSGRGCGACSSRPRRSPAA